MYLQSKDSRARRRGASLFSHFSYHEAHVLFHCSARHVLVSLPAVFSLFPFNDEFFDSSQRGENNVAENFSATCNQQGWKIRFVGHLVQLLFRCRNQVSVLVLNLRTIESSKNLNNDLFKCKNNFPLE